MTLYTITTGRNKKINVQTTSLSKARDAAYRILAERLADRKKYSAGRMYFTSAREDVRIINGETRIVLYATAQFHGYPGNHTYRVVIRCTPIVKTADNEAYNNLSSLMKNFEGSDN